MSLFAGWIKRQNPRGIVDRFGIGASTGRLAHQTQQHIHEEPAELLALDGDPFLKRRCVGERDTFEKVAPVERGGLAQRLGRAAWLVPRRLDTCLEAAAI